MLEDTPGLVHRQDEPPADEADLQAIMHDYSARLFRISAKIPDRRLDQELRAGLRHRQRRSGTSNSRSPTLRRSGGGNGGFTGVVEDTGGYNKARRLGRDSNAVMYQAKPFIPEEPPSERYEAHRRGHLEGHSRSTACGPKPSARKEEGFDQEIILTGDGLKQWQSGSICRPALSYSSLVQNRRTSPSKEIKISKGRMIV